MVKKNSNEDVLYANALRLPKMFLKVLNKEGTVFTDENGAIYTLEFNIHSGSYDLKKHNEGNAKAKPRLEEFKA